MASEYDDDSVVQAIMASKRRLTDLKIEAMLYTDTPMPQVHDIDALADEVVARMDGQRPVSSEPARS